MVAVFAPGSWGSRIGVGVGAAGWPGGLFQL